jgi:hypothetical protein
MAPETIRTLGLTGMYLIMLSFPLSLLYIIGAFDQILKKFGMKPRAFRNRDKPERP